MRGIVIVTHHVLDRQDNSRSCSNKRSWTAYISKIVVGEGLGASEATRETIRAEESRSSSRRSWISRKDVRGHDQLKEILPQSRSAHNATYDTNRHVGYMVED